MIAVYKYPLPIQDIVTLRLPDDAEPLHVAVQNDQVCLWVRLDTTKPVKPHRFRIAGTGHPNADGQYIGTIILHEGSLVFHVFDLDYVGTINGS